MVERLILPLFAFIFGAVLALQGCAPLSVSSSGDSSPGMTQTSMTDSQENGGVHTSSTMNPPTYSPSKSPSKSSLEAMQQGELAVTPKAFPLQDVRYDFDDYVLRADARETLKRNAEWLKANPSVRIEIEGHADERGTNEYNLALGSKRAQTSKDYLISLGVREDRLNTVSYGEEVPACREQTEICWQINRRARFVILRMGPTL